MPARVSKTQNEPKTEYGKFNKKLKKAGSNLRAAQRKVWGSASKAPMMLGKKRKPVTRPKPNNPSETYTYVPQPKFRFVPDEAYVVAGAGAMMHAYRNLKTRGKDYRTFVPPEEKRYPVFSTVSEGAKSMLNYFLQSYAAECGTYARLLREGAANTGRINSQMMEVGMEMADSKVFGAANHCKHLFAPTAEKQPSDAAKSKTAKATTAPKAAAPKLNKVEKKKAPKDKSAEKKKTTPKEKKKTAPETSSDMVIED